MTSDDTRERFRKAVTLLVAEPGDIKDRLMVAYISQLSEINGQQDLPHPLSDMFDRITFTLATHGRRGDASTVSKELEILTDEDASEISKQLFNIFLELHDLNETTSTSEVDCG